jgi:glycosyltransferase involved in cell wall biosynthesis
MPAKPRVLVVTTTFPLGPADAATPPFVQQLCAHLARDFDVDVLTPHAPGAARRETVMGLEVFRHQYAPERWQRLTGPGGIPAQLRGSPWRALLVPLLLASQFWALWRMLGRRRYAVVHAHWIVPGGLIAAAALVLRRSAPPLVVTVHGTDAVSFDRAPLAALKRWVAGRAAAVAAVSPALRERLAARLPSGRLRVLPMGADLSRRFVAPPAGTRVPGRIVFAGRLVQAKGIFTLVEALARVRAAQPAAHLWIAGDGPEGTALRERVRHLGLDPHVQFCGALDQARLAALFGQAEVVALPSMSEGLGLVAIEALGCECAVVASDIPALRDTVVHETTGLTVAAGSVDALTAALLRLLADAGLRQRLGRAGRQHVLRYDWPRAADAYAQLFASVAA